MPKNQFIQLEGETFQHFFDKKYLHDEFKKFVGKNIQFSSDKKCFEGEHHRLIAIKLFALGFWLKKESK